MSFSLPTFNLAVKINRHATGLVGPGDVNTVGNLAWGRRANVPIPATTTSGIITALSPVLLLPAGTDVRDAFCPSNFDFVEVPSGSGRWYGVAYVDDIGKGFANEHRAATLYKAAAWPQPIP
jgi:hypothetical protein